MVWVLFTFVLMSPLQFTIALVAMEIAIAKLCVEYSHIQKNHTTNTNHV